MSIGTVGIIGAGQMGAGVAQVAAQAGVKVLLTDISEDFVARGREIVARNLDRMVQRGRWQALMDQCIEVPFVTDRPGAEGNLATEDCQQGSEVLRHLDLQYAPFER